MIKVYENPHTEIYDISDEIPNTVFAYWKGYLFLNNAEAVDACQASLDYFKEKNIKIMISDHQYLEGAEVEFLDWLQSYYFPTAIQNGLKAEIILDSSYDMGNVSLDLMYAEEDMQKYIDKKALYTPKVNTFENAKKLS